MDYLAKEFQANGFIAPVFGSPTVTSCMAVVTHVAQYLDLDALQLPPFVSFVGAKVGRGLQQPSARQHGKWELNMDGSQQHLPFFASIHGALHMLRTAYASLLPWHFTVALPRKTGEDCVLFLPNIWKRFEHTVLV